MSQFERHIYLFTGSAGQLVTITMVSTSGSVDPVLTLFDPAGQAIATDDNSGGGTTALLRDIRLPVDGDYIIQALGGGGAAGGLGGYQISLQAQATVPPISLALPTAATPTATPPLGTTTPVASAPDSVLADHVPVLAVIDHPGAFGRFFVEAEAGDLLTIGVRRIEGSLVLPHVEIYNPAGELMLATDPDSSGQVLISGMGVLESGSYAIFVSDAGRGGGAYSVAYGRGSTHTDDLLGAIPPDVAVVSGGLAGVRERWTLALNSGDEAAIEAPGAEVQISAPDGEPVSESADAVQFDAKQTGSYTVTTTGSSPPATYKLIWRLIAAAPTPAPAVLILSADDPLPPQTYVDYPFQGRAGKRVHVRVQALDADLDPVAALLDAAGTTIAEGDDSPDSLNPDFEALLPTDGTYHLRVNAYGEKGGKIRVTVEMQRG